MIAPKPLLLTVLIILSFAAVAGQHQPVHAFVTQNFSYSTNDASTISPAPQLTYIFGGEAQVVDLTSTPTGYLEDAGSTWHVSPANIGTNPSWSTTDTLSGISGASAVVIHYYDQRQSVFWFTATSYPSQTTTTTFVSYYSYNVLHTITAYKVGWGGSVQFGWVDIGSTATYGSVLPNSNSSVQWYAYTAAFTMATSDITCDYTLQFYLTVYNGGHGTTSGSGWYDSGGSAAFSVSTPVSGGSGIQYVNTGWTGDASSSPVTMNSPKSVTAAWKTQYYVTVNSAHDTPTGAGWYDSGTTATIGVTSPVSGGAGVQYIFTSWSGTVYGGSDNPASFTVTTAATETAGWGTQYYLTVANGGHGTGTGQAWYDSGASAQFGINTPVAGAAGTQYAFSAWTGSGGGSYSGSGNPHSVTMNNAITETAAWTTQYYLSVASSLDSPFGGGWYNSGANASFGLTSTTSGNDLTRGTFSNWTEVGSGGYSGTNVNNTVTMGNPINETANWASESNYVNVTSFSVSVSRVGTGTAAAFSANGTYYFGEGTWHGSFTLNDSSSKSAVGIYGYRISTVVDSLFGVTLFTQTAANLSVVFDKVNVTITSSSSRISIGANASISYSGTFLYDGAAWHGVATLGNPTTESTVGNFSYATVSITDPTYGILSFQSNTRYVVFDEVNFTLTPPFQSLTAGQNASISLAGVYAFDGAAWAGTFSLNDSTTKGANGTYIYVVAAMTDSLHALTAFQSNTVAATFGASTTSITCTGFTSAGSPTFYILINGIPATYSVVSVDINSWQIYGISLGGTNATWLVQTRLYGGLPVLVAAGDNSSLTIVAISDISKQINVTTSGSGTFLYFWVGSLGQPANVVEDGKYLTNTTWSGLLQTEVVPINGGHYYLLDYTPAPSSGSSGSSGTSNGTGAPPSVQEIATNPALLLPLAAIILIIVVASVTKEVRQHSRGAAWDKATKPGAPNHEGMNKMKKKTSMRNKLRLRKPKHAY